MNENVANKFDPFAILDEARLQRQINSITGGGGSALTLTDGVNTVDDVAQILVSGGTVGGASPDATLTVGGGSGSASLPLPFFGLTGGAPWVRPSLNIGGPSSAFNTWLNQGGQVYAYGASGYSNNGTGPAVAAGTVYAPGDTITIAGGTGTAAVGTITDTQLVSATIVSPGTGGTPGSAQVIGTTGAGPQLFILDVTIGGGGTITSIDDINNAGDYTTNPTVLAVEPVADNSSSGITGASVSVVMGALAATPTAPGAYTVNPTNPVSQASSSGSGTGATWNLLVSALATATNGSDGLPLVLAGASLPVTAITALLRPIGAGPWTVTTAVANPAISSRNQYGASTPIILYDSVAQKATAIYWPAADNAGGAVSVVHYTSIDNPAFTVGTTLVIPDGSGTNQQWFLSPTYFLWFRIQNDGTNLTYSVSFEDVAFIPILQEALSDFGASYDFVGFGTDRSSVGVTVGGAPTALVPLWNFTQTSP